MGGLGSGRWKRSQTRQLTTHGYCLDVAQVAELLRTAAASGRAAAMALHFPVLTSSEPSQAAGAALLGVLADHGRLRLGVPLGDGDDTFYLSEWVNVVSTPCRFGGERFWFLCPACDRRCAVLYRGVGKDAPCFRCRVCLGLAYPVQNERRAMALGRAYTKARGRLLRGGSETELLYPPRPKGMHTATYERLAERQVTLLGAAVDAEMDAFKMLGRYVERLQSQMDARR